VRNLGGQEARQRNDQLLALADETFRILQSELGLFDDLVQLDEEILRVHVPTRSGTSPKTVMPYRKRPRCKALRRVWRYLLINAVTPRLVYQAEVAINRLPISAGLAPLADILKRERLCAAKWNEPPGARHADC
jgi:hypothetical protein